MVRPRKCRRVFFEPQNRLFKPQSVPAASLRTTVLTVDELEALRLSDLEKLSQVQAAEKMGIHQSTFQRTLSRAREKVANALIHGQAIKIDGGDYKMPFGDGTGPITVGRGAGRGRGFGRGAGGFANRSSNAGPGGVCVCPNCSYEEPHVRGVPCVEKKCPKCGSQMMRKIN